MGAWGVLAFDNDSACDWAYDLEDADDLSLVESVFDELEEDADAYLESDVGVTALAACEVLARLQGRPGYQNSYTETVDAWVKAHPSKPSAALIKRANQAIDRVLADQSELAELWADSEDGAKWLASVKDLRQRVLG